MNEYIKWEANIVSVSTICEAKQSKRMNPRKENMVDKNSTIMYPFP